MDVAGSFLELSCVRIALVPAGPPIPDHRFEELTSHLTAFREVPVSSLPRRAAVPRVSGSSTFTGVPASFRDAIDAASPSSLLRSRSATKDIGRRTHGSLTSPKAQGMPQRKTSMSYSSTRLGNHAVAYQKLPQPPRISARNTAELDMTGPEVDSSFRLRYDVIHRDQGGDLIMRPFSEWDDFHSSKIWGVFGIVDCTQPSIGSDAGRRKETVFAAYEDFSTTLGSFNEASVRRLLVFTSHETEDNVPFVIDDPKSPLKTKASPLLFSVGYVPERSKYLETRQETKAQVIHFAGLLLNAIDRDSWKRRESPATELFMSPIDEKYSVDRQSKLTKRRSGRLDKLLADGLLLMGCPSEALIKYNSAIEKAKANSDRLWLAGAMEGWSAAHVLSYVGTGGSVRDTLLSDRLIEYYADIYKLYQKKRVAEPEAAAALRLAEFLGRWTDRRKDALDAAEHAATVGEGLRAQKRAALWEALARFSDRMKCRRKAALFLYRLGQLNASQSIWSSAVTLTIAAERQLSRDGKKSWPELNRKVLLTAAEHAEEAGDSDTAARLYVEAIVLPLSSTAARRDEDRSLIESLRRAQVPAYLPAADGVVSLDDITALQIPGLTIHERETEDSASLVSGAKDGPFIYNPFEAKKLAKEAAVARRAVTWVSGEPAQVSARLINNTCTELAVDIIAVLLSPCQDDKEVGEPFFRVDENEADNNGAESEEESRSAKHTYRVRQALHESGRIAKTISETLNLRSGETTPGSVKQLTLIPKRTGPLQVYGLLVRLFNGALVFLRAKAGSDKEVSPVNVICQLPRISLTSYSDESGAMENVSSRSPLVVYEGERRTFRIEVENTGTQRIATTRAKVFSSHPEALEIISHEFQKGTLLRGLENPGSSKSFLVEVLGKQRYVSVCTTNAAWRISNKATSLSVVSIVLEYEGTDSIGLIRESGIYVKVSSKIAVRAETLNLLEVASKAETIDSGNPESSAQCVSLEVTNLVAAPATVKLRLNSKYFTTLQPHEVPLFGSFGQFSDSECLVERGASARLISYVRCSPTSERRSDTEVQQSQSNSFPPGKSSLQVLWSIPALGRYGVYEFCHDGIMTLGSSRSDIDVEGTSKNSGNPGDRSPAFASLAISINAPLEHKEGAMKDLEGHNPIVRLGKFWSATFRIKDIPNVALPPNCVLDIELIQGGGTGIQRYASRPCIIGATHRVRVKSLPFDSDELQHTIRVRMTSTGIFKLRGCLHDISEQVLGTNKRVMGNRDNYSPTKQLPQQRKEETVSSFPLSFLRDATNSSESVESEGSSQERSNLIIESGPSKFYLAAPEETPPGLKRVGIMQRRSIDGGKKKTRPVDVLQPTTIDSYPEGSPCNFPSSIIANSEVSFAVVQDAAIEHELEM